jgi:uncharacterized membrane protein
MSTENKKSGQAIWVAGTLLVVLGVALLIFGLVSFVVSFPPCPINACPPIFSAYYAVYWSEIFAGLVMIALGIGLRFQARRIQRRLADSIQNQQLLPRLPEVCGRTVLVRVYG